MFTIAFSGVGNLTGAFATLPCVLKRLRISEHLIRELRSDLSEHLVRDFDQFYDSFES